MVLVKCVETPAPFFIEPYIIDMDLAVIVDLHFASYPIAPRSKAAHYTRSWLEEGT